MRRVLKSVLSRVDDLAERVSPSCAGWDWAKIEKEDDEEIWARVMTLVRKSGGPDKIWPEAGFDSDDGWMQAEVRERWKQELNGRALLLPVLVLPTKE